MGLVQRAIEAEGVSTISITMAPAITRRLFVPRAVAVGFPLGHPLGFPGQAFLQRRILAEALRHAKAAGAPGTIVDLGIGGDSADACRACGPAPD